MKFCTAINCMDGRVQLPVIQFLQKHFDAEYVDMITAAGPNRILADGIHTTIDQALLDRLRISAEAHGSVGLAIVGHHDCAGNPTPEATQTAHTKEAIAFIQTLYPDMPIIGLWVDENWTVNQLDLA